MIMHVTINGKANGETSQHEPLSVRYMLALITCIYLVRKKPTGKQEYDFEVFVRKQHTGCNPY